MNTWDVAHGGVTMTLADIALAMAARSLAGDGVGVVTVEMKVNFMQPGRGELRASARVLHRSTTMAYCEGEIRDSEGHFVAKALGTFKYMRRLAVGRDIDATALAQRPVGETRSERRLSATLRNACASGQTRAPFLTSPTPFNRSDH